MGRRGKQWVGDVSNVASYSTCTWRNLLCYYYICHFFCNIINYFQLRYTSAWFTYEGCENIVTCHS